MDRYYLDSNVVISVVELTEFYDEPQEEFIRRVDGGLIEAVTSELTLAECLVKPLADRNTKAIDAYLAFLDGRPEFPVLPISRKILLAAAQLRAQAKRSLADAIHVATAVDANCSIFLTSDRRIRGSGDMRIAWWDELRAEKG